jgi:uncharacterized protein YdiU (UPF0061 family)
MQITTEFYKLGNEFYTPTKPQPKIKPKLVIKNDELLTNFNINLSDDTLTNVLSGNKILSDFKPIASVYAGHQFGSFNPQLGDGRAIILGNIKNSGSLYEIALKGSGRTKYSRGGDGMLAIGSAMREYLLSEYMRALDIPTTYALAITTSDDKVMRDSILPSAVLTRAAKSFVRIGTFEYFLANNNFAAIKKLADYLILHYFPDIKTSDYLGFFESVCNRQANLIASWQALGFIHGVMNTDNMSIVGETIDYGPCAFLDEFNSKKVFSSIDYQGRYAFNNQATIAHWNLTSLANCLLILFNNNKQIISQFARILDDFMDNFHTHYYHLMSKKLGGNFAVSEIDNLLILLEKNQIDYTEFFYNLTIKNNQELKFIYTNFSSWFDSWQQQIDLDNYRQIMSQNNPFIIPRNHQIEKVINLANDYDFSYFYEFALALQNPFIKNERTQKFAIPPKPSEKITQTFCGT